jgi:CHAT domain-containing protein/Tfp pilus assembly protein PilF
MKRATLFFLFISFSAAYPAGGLPETPAALKKGVVVEDVGKGSVSEKAGLKPGDILLSWERLDPPADEAAAARGDITTVFDLTWVQVEQGARGPIRFGGGRDGEPGQFVVPVGTWALSVQPLMPADVLGKYIKGKELIANKDTAAGIAFWADVSKWASENGDKGLTCWILQKTGAAWADEKNWEAALSAFQSVVKEAETAGIQIARVYSLKSIGRIQAARKEREKAEAVFRQALALCQETWGRSLCLAECHETLAAYYRQWDDPLQMTEQLNQSLEIFLELAPESPGASRVLINRGVIEHNQGNLKKADEYYRRGLKIAEKLTPGSITVAYALDNIGNIASIRGFLEEAEGSKRRALEIKERLAPESKDVAYTLQSLAIIAAKRMDYEAAGAYMERALAIYEKIGPNSPELAGGLVNMGNYYRDIQEYKKAREVYLRALEIREAISPESPEVANIQSFLGELAEKDGNLDEAERLNKRALEIYVKNPPEDLDVAFCLSNLASVARKRGDLQTEEAYLQRALKIKTDLTPSSSGRAATIHELGVLFEKTTRIPQAEEAYRQAIEILEAQVETLGGTAETKAQFRQAYKYLYQDYLDLLNKLDKQTEAFHILERYRAQLLLAMLSERDIIWTAEIPEELDRERQSLARDYDRTQHELVEFEPQKDKDKIDELQAGLRELQAKQAEVISRIKKASPKYASLRYPQPLDVKGVQAVLDPGTVLLSYSIGEKAGYLFILTSGDFKAVPLALGEADLKEEVEKLNLAIQRGQSGLPLADSFFNQGKKLYEELVAPAEEILAKGDRILIIPDGPLHSLPFPALVRPKADKAKQGSFLAEWKSVHTVLSATVFSELKKQRKPAVPLQAKRVLLAFGDPDYPRAEKDQPIENEEAIARSMRKRGFDLAPLPGTREEVMAIAGLFGPQAEIHVGKEATEERAKAAGRDIPIIHFACHGLLDDLFPLNSGLALSMPAQPLEGQENGLLQAWEIFEQVRIDADLVTLSACDTGSGKEMGGEGLVGLARAFQYAGARSVLASQWKVADAATSELMKRFYAGLKSGMPKDQALQAAQKELIRSRIPAKDSSGRTVELDASHPFYWAAFQLIGDWK